MRRVDVFGDHRFFDEDIGVDTFFREDLVPVESDGDIVHAFSAIGSSEAAQLHGQTELGAWICPYAIKIKVNAIERIAWGEGAVVVEKGFVFSDGSNGIIIGAREIEIIVLGIGSTWSVTDAHFLAEFGLITILGISQEPEFGEVLSKGRGCDCEGVYEGYENTFHRVWKGLIRTLYRDLCNSQMAAYLAP